MATGPYVGSGNDYQYRGCNVNTAEQVACDYTIPSPPRGSNLVIYGIDLRVGGASGENGSVRGAVWNSDGTNGAFSSTTTVGGTSPSSTLAYEYLNISDKLVTSGQNTLVGFWRNDGSCSYTTSWSFDTNQSSTTIWYDNSASSAGNFGKSSTAYTTASLCFRIHYYYDPAASTIASLVPYNGGVTVNWSGPSDWGDASGSYYYVQYSTDNATWTNTSTTGVGTMNVGNLYPGTTYYFRVISVATSGLYSISSSSSTKPYGVPNPPTSFSGTSGDNQVSLSWVASTVPSGSPAATSYSIYYKKSTDTLYTFVKNVATTTATISNGDLINNNLNTASILNGNSYLFYIFANNTMGGGNSAGPISIIPAGAPIAGTVSAYAGLAGATSVINVSWTAFETNGSALTSHIVKYNTVNDPNDATWTVASSSISAGATSYTIGSGVTAGTPYYIKVGAVNGVGGTYAYYTNAFITPVNTITPFSASQPPSSPLDLYISAVPSSTSLSLSWTVPQSDGASAITSYIIEYSQLPDFSIVGIIDTGSTSTSYTVTSLTAGLLYYFRVKAKNGSTLNIGYGGSGIGSPSNIVNNTELATAPTDLLITNSTSTSISLSWTASSGIGGSLISDYKIEYSLSSSFSTYNTFSHTASTSTSITVTGLASGSIYYFRVKAINSGGESPASNIATNAPVSIFIDTSNSSYTSAFINWTYGIQSVSSYKLYYRALGSPTWILYASPTTTYYKVNGLTSSSTHEFKVNAVYSGGGLSIDSDILEYENCTVNYPVLDSVDPTNFDGYEATFLEEDPTSLNAPSMYYEYTVDNLATWNLVSGNNSSTNIPTNIITSIVTPVSGNDITVNLTSAISYNNVYISGLSGIFAQLNGKYTADISNPSSIIITKVNTLTSNTTYSANTTANGATNSFYGLVHQQIPVAQILVPDLTLQERYNMIVRATNLAGTGNSNTLTAFITPYGYLSVYDGSNWKYTASKVYDGASWNRAPAKVWSTNPSTGLPEWRPFQMDFSKIDAEYSTGSAIDGGSPSSVQTVTIDDGGV